MKFNSRKIEENAKFVIILLFIFINLAYIFDWFGLKSFDKERTGDDCSENSIVCFGEEKREV